MARRSARRHLEEQRWLRQFGDEWKTRVDVEAEVSLLPIVVKGRSVDGCWLRALCPFHKDTQPSASICIRATANSEPGHFTCEVCPPHPGAEKFGLNIVGLIAELTGATTQEAFQTLRERYFPGMVIPKERTESVHALPDAALLGKWHDRLLAEADEHAKIAMDNLRHRRIADRKLLEELQVGYNDRWLTLPMRDQQGVLQNVEFRNVDTEAKRTKIRRITGRPIIPYPLWLIDLKSKRRVVCEGATDLMTLWALGDRDAITIGGTSQTKFARLRPYLPSGEGTRVYIALDNDDAGRSASKNLIAELLQWSEGPAQVFPLTGALPKGCDINNVVVQCRDLEHAKEHWAHLLSAAPLRTPGDHVEFGLAEAEDQIILESSGEVVADFTGKVIQTGRERLGSEIGERFYRIQLTHSTGEKIDVYHPMGTRATFEASIQKSAGKTHLFKFLSRYDDSLLTFFIRATGADLAVKDHGWLFGEDDESGEEKVFHTPRVTFTPSGGAVPQTAIQYDPPHPFFESITLPPPDVSAAPQALRLLWQHAYQCHIPSVMGLLLASALLAPIRKRYFVFQPRFPILVFGPSGAGKTSRCRIVQSLLGDFSDENSVLSWRSTSKSIEYITSIAGDMWMLVDEMQIDKLSKMARMEAFEFLKSIPQGISRTRMKSTGESLHRPPPMPRSLVAITMEAMAIEDEGLLARCLLVKVPATSLFSEPYRTHYDAVWLDQSLLQQAMSLWLQETIAEGFKARLSVIYKNAKEICDTALQEVCAEWRSVPNVPRLVNRLQVLTSVWHAAIDFSIRAKAIAPQEAKAIVDQWQQVIRESLALSLKTFRQGGLEQSYLDVVASGLQSGACHLELIGRTTRQGWDVIPKTRGPNSKLVGFYQLVPNPTSNSISYLGQEIEIALSSSSALMWGAGDTSHIWTLARQYLANAGLLTEAMGDATHRTRILWLNRKGSQLFMEGVEGYTASARATGTTAMRIVRLEAPGEETGA